MLQGRGGERGGGGHSPGRRVGWGWAWRQSSRSSTTTTVSTPTATTNTYATTTGCSRACSCTMEVFSMLKHTIISDNVNPINGHFELGRQTGSAGPEMVWKIYEAVRKEDKKVSWLGDGDQGGRGWMNWRGGMIISLLEVKQSPGDIDKFVVVGRRSDQLIIHITRLLSAYGSVFLNPCLSVLSAYPSACLSLSPPPPPTLPLSVLFSFYSSICL